MNIKNKIRVPKIFQIIHGEETTIFNFILVYLTAFISTTLSIFLFLHYEFSLWGYILIGFVVFDISGGVIANFSHSTKKYYRKKNLKIPFLILNIISPLILYLVFFDYFYYFVFLALYTFIVSFFIISIKNNELQRNLASLFLVIGFICSAFFNLDIYLIYILGGLYMIKIILGFSTNNFKEIK